MTDTDTTTDTTYESIGIGVPRPWVELPVDQAQFDRLCAGLSRRWEEGQNWDRATQRQAELLLVRLRRDLLRVRAQFAAMYISGPVIEDTPRSAADENADSDEAVNDDAADLASADDPAEPAQPRALMASVVVGTYTKADLGTDADLTLGNLASAFGGDSPAETAGGTVRITNVEPPAQYQIPVGESIRLRRNYEITVPTLLPDHFYGETYFTPLNDGDRCLVTHFVTPNLDESPLFSELFAQIADTVTGFTADQATVFESDWVGGHGG